MFPMVTMMRLLVHAETQFTEATILVGSVTNPCVKIPAGMKYILAMECSKPLETKAMMGNQMPKNFPMRSSAQIPRRIPRFTSQLHPMALRNADHMPAVPTYAVFAPAMAMARDPKAVTVAAPAASQLVKGPYAIR